MSQLQGGMGTAANGASQLYAGAGALQSGSRALSNGLGPCWLYSDIGYRC